MNIHQILVIGGAVADWSKALPSGEKINGYKKDPGFAPRENLKKHFVITHKNLFSINNLLVHRELIECVFEQLRQQHLRWEEGRVQLNSAVKVLLLKPKTQNPLFQDSIS